MTAESIDRIMQYVTKTSGLNGSSPDGRSIKISQKVDGKSVVIDQSRVETVLERVDQEGNDFIQVNFFSGVKILLTDRLVGFKPVPFKGVETAKLPNVVTTPDLFSVFEAIQDAMSDESPRSEDVDLLKRVFDSVVQGGEAIGFDLSDEKTWMARLPSLTIKASA